MLPLALSMAGAMVKDQPLDASSWRTLHETLQKKYIKLKEMRSEEMKSIFSTIDASVDILPRIVREQLLLMAVLASGVAASSDMLASLWDVVRNYQYLSAWFVGLYTSPLWGFFSLGVLIQLITLLLASLSYPRTVNNLGESSKPGGDFLYLVID